MKMSPHQLVTVERNSPHIKERSNEIWKYIVERDFSKPSIDNHLYKYHSRPKKVSLFERLNDYNQTHFGTTQRKKVEDTPPTDLEKRIVKNLDEIDCRRLYFDLSQDMNQKMQEASAKLRSSMKKVESERLSNSIVQLERDPRSAQYRVNKRINQNAPIGTRIWQKSLKSALNRSTSLSRPSRPAGVDNWKNSNLSRPNNVGTMSSVRRNGNDKSSGLHQTPFFNNNTALTNSKSNAIAKESIVNRIFGIGKQNEVSAKVTSTRVPISSRNKNVDTQSSLTSQSLVSKASIPSSEELSAPNYTSVNPQNPTQDKPALEPTSVPILRKRKRISHPPSIFIKKKAR